MPPDSPPAPGALREGQGKNLATKTPGAPPSKPLRSVPFQLRVDAARRVKG